MGMVYICTTAYNAEKTLCRCMDSVLNQTYQEFTYYICDNGSTDKTTEIIRDYVTKDPRIRPYYNLQNNIWNEESLEYVEFRRKLNDDDFICILDSDDEYMPTFLEEMLEFLKLYQLDFAVCGSAFVQTADNRAAPNRVLPRQLLLQNPLDFTELFPVYHQFMRTLWGKLYTGKAARNIHTLQTRPKVCENLAYGSDTLSVFSVLRHVKRVGIMPRVLHRYYVSQKSSSYKWNPKRIESDQILYDDAVSFLCTYGPVSPENRSFLQCVYSNAIFDTTNVIHNSTLSPVDKLREYRRIAIHPLTQAAYRECRDESAVRSRATLLQRILQAGSALHKESSEDFQIATQLLSPHCGQAVSALNAPLFLAESKLFQALSQDEPEAVLHNFLLRMEKKQGIKKHGIPQAIQALARDNPLLSRIDDTVFLRKYGNLYKKVWKGEYLSALDEMTELLLEGKVAGGQETYLQLYISLSALLEQAPAFVFGKIRLAHLYLRQNRRNDCQATLDELEEMGVENTETLALHQKLEIMS